MGRHFDCIVVGGGAAGLATAIGLAQGCCAHPAATKARLAPDQVSLPLP
ncbi:MAG TPA: hypothetical protein PKW21_02005 [Rhabdaerophilum sp.]|nr:hypothetical protein [Rhabdaerophilum sp.]